MIILAALITALVVGVTAELVGVARHDRGKVDTYTEIVHWVGEGLGPGRFALAAGIVALMGWAIPHLARAIIGF